jgi:hypothetical protein
MQFCLVISCVGNWRRDGSWVQNIRLLLSLSLHVCKFKVLGGRVELRPQRLEILQSEIAMSDVSYQFYRAMQ